MATRANYTLIGLFTLLVIAGAFGFVFWFQDYPRAGSFGAMLLTTALFVACTVAFALFIGSFFDRGERSAQYLAASSALVFFLSGVPWPFEAMPGPLAALAECVDIFIESIAFDLDDARRIFACAREHGLKVRAHAEQLSASGAAALAAELGALSCDHLEYLDEAGARAMARGGCVAVLLPGAYYFLRETRGPPVPLLREHGIPMAVASDLNPGTSPVASLLTALHMSVTLFGLTPDEALLGVTCHAARALGRDDIGSLTPGRRADFTLWDVPEPEFLTYQLGGLRPRAIFIEGQRVGPT